MASLEKTVSIIFAGDDRVSKTIGQVTASLDQLNTGAQQIASPFAKLAEGVLAVDAALGTLAAAGLTYAFIKSKDFESATVELQKVLGDEISLLGDAKDAALELSGQYGESATDILRSTANFKQAGFDVQGAMQLTKDALDLVIAGDLEAAEASEILVSVLKGFKAPADDAARVVDILNEVSNRYATSVVELGRGMANLSPIANQMGFSFEETAGILTPVIEVFRSGDEAAVALKTGLLRLISDTAPVTDALSSIGVAQKDSNGVLRSGRDILYDVAQAFTTLDQDMKLYIASELVGIRQAGRMVEVFDQLSKTTEITSVALDAAGSAAEEVAIRLASAEVVVNRFKTGFENLGIIIGDQFRGAVAGAIEGGIDLENAIQEMVQAGTFDPVFDRINLFSQKIGNLLSTIATNLPDAFEDVDWSGFFDALDLLGRELADLFDVDLTDPADLRNVVQGLIDTLEALTRVTAGMVDFFDPIFDSIREAIRQFNNLDEESQKAFGNVLAAAQLVVTAGIYVTGAIVAIKESGADITNVFNAIVGSIRTAWNILQAAFDAVVLHFTGVAQGILTVLDAITFGSSETIGIAKSAIKDLNLAILSHGWDQLKEAAEGANQAVAGFSGEAYGAKESTDELSDSIKTAGDELIDWSQVDAVKDLIIEPSLDENKATAAQNRAEEVISQITPVIPLEPRIDEVKLKEIQETIQKSIEWQAKIDIAQIEAAAKVSEAAFESIGESATAASKLIGELFGLVSKTESPIERYKLEQQIRNEEKRQQERHDAQMRLTEIQTRLAEASLESREAGEAIINIQADGLKPHLEAILWEILEAIQIRANESQAEFLLGVT